MINLYYLISRFLICCIKLIEIGQRFKTSFVKNNENWTGQNRRITYAICRQVKLLDVKSVRKQYQQYFCIKNYLMSLAEQELQQHADYMPFQSLKIQNQFTSVCLKGTNTTQPTNFQFEPCLFNLTDCSFQQGIHHENMEILGNFALKYLQESLTVPVSKLEGFRDSSLYENPPFEIGIGSELQKLTIKNELLTTIQQEQLLNFLKEEEELIGLLRQAVPVFGITVSKELVYAIFQLLKNKLKGFKAITTEKPAFLPRFDCFQGFIEEEFPYHSSCAIYQDFNLEEIAQFAQNDLEELSSSLYFGNQIRYLNLRDILPDTQGNILQRFNKLMKQISRTVFYTLVGAVEPSTGNNIGGSFFDLSREISFTEFSEGTILSIHRSSSRPFVPCDDEPGDFLTKRLKFQ